MSTKDTESSPDIDPKIIARPLTISEYELIAHKKLPTQVWDYYVSGADAQQTQHRNQLAYERLLIRPRVFRDVRTIDTTTSLFDRKFEFPIGVSPSAMQKLVGGEGELDMARGVADRGTFMCLSSNSTCDLVDVIETGRAARLEAKANEDLGFWLQIYIAQDRSKTKALIQRADKAGYVAIAITVDTPVLGNRINERRTPLVLPSPLSLPNLDDKDADKGKKPSLNREFLDARDKETAARIVEQGKGRGVLNDAGLTWDETIPWVKSCCGKMKVLVKGVMTAEDAVLAVEGGADGIVVSNHGGRQLDGIPSTVEVLPEIVEAVAGKVPVIVDGGVTRGSDVFKCIALGADFVMVGRAVLWGLATSGQDGVKDVLNILEREFTRTMTLAGAKNVNEIKRDMLGVQKKDGFGIIKL